MAKLGAGGLAARVAPAAVYQSLVVTAMTLVKTAASATVLARYERAIIPTLYVCAAALTAVLGTIFATRKSKPLEPEPVAYVGALITAVLCLFLKQGFAAAALTIFIFVDLFATYANLGFWARMVLSFDPRESRRAFAIIGAFGMGGSILGGWTGQILAQRWGAVSLLVVGTTLLILGGGIFRFQPAPSLREPRAPDWNAVGRYIAKDPFPRRLALLVLMLAGMGALADFQFRASAAAAFTEKELAVMFSNLHFRVGLVCCVFQLAIATPLLRTLGVLGYLALIPLLFAVVTGALWFYDVWELTYLLKFIEMATTLSLIPLGLQLLYAPVPDSLRNSVRAGMDVLVKKGGFALAGGILLLLRAAPGPDTLSLLLAMIGIAAWTLVRLKPAYVSALQRRVSPLDAGAAETMVVAEPLLVERLTDPSPAKVFTALSWMEQQGINLQPHLPKLLAHPNERVLERGIRYAVDCQATETVAQLEALLTSPHRRPRNEAVWALGQLAPERAAKVLPSLLATPDVGFRCAIVTALLDGPEAAVAEQVFLQLMEEALTARAPAVPVSERRSLAQVFGKLSDGRWSIWLERFLDDEEPTVQRAAVIAAGEGRFHSLAPQLLWFLNVRGERRFAREALAKMGDAVVPLLERTMNDRSLSADLRYQVPRTLRQIGTQAALEALLFSNVQDDAFLHYRIGVALSRLREEHPELEVDGTWVREAIERRRQVHLSMEPLYRALKAELGEDALLTRAVRDRLEQALELTFWLLGLLYPAKPLRRAHQQLLGTDARRKAWALELLENLVPNSDRAALMEQLAVFLPDVAPAKKMAIRLSMDEALENLLECGDPILKSCAKYYQHRMPGRPASVQETNMSEDRVKRMFALEGVEIFANSPVDDLAAVAALMQEVSFAQGERIYAEGDPGDSLYVIVKGSVRALRNGEYVLTAGENEAFGDLSLLDGAPRPVEMVAAEPTEALVIERGDFLDLVSDRPELMKGVLRGLSRQFKTVLDLPRTFTPKAVQVSAA